MEFSLFKTILRPLRSLVFELRGDFLEDETNFITYNNFAMRQGLITLTI